MTEKQNSCRSAPTFGELAIDCSRAPGSEAVSFKDQAPVLMAVSDGMVFFSDLLDVSQRALVAHWVVGT